MNGSEFRQRCDALENPGIKELSCGCHVLVTDDTFVHKRICRVSMCIYRKFDKSPVKKITYSTEIPFGYELFRHFIYGIMP